MADSDKVILLKIEVEKSEASLKIDKLKASLKDLDGRRKKARAISRKLRLEEAKLADLRNRNSKSISKHANELKNANKQTGAATSATLEFGRVLSDAPYGIRGVANNIQQLASNLFFMGKQVDKTTGKTIGFKGAIGSLLKNLAGPAGILVAFQGLIALWDYLSTGTKEAKDETSELNDEMERSAKILAKVNTVLGTLNNAGNSINFDAVDSLISGVKELDTKGVLRILERDIKGITNAFNKLPKEEQNIKGIKSIVQKKKVLINSLLNEKIIKNELNELNKEQIRLSKFGDSVALDKTKEDIIRKQKELFAVQKVIIDIEELFRDKKEERTALKDPKDFDEEAEDYLDQIRSLDKKTELLNAKSQAAKIIIQRKYHLEDLKRKNIENSDEFKLEAEAYKAKLELFLAYQVSIGKMTKSQANQQLSDFDETIKKEIDEMNTNFPILLGKWDSYYTKKIELAKEAEMMGAKAPKTKDKKDEDSDLEFGIKQYMILQSSLTDFLNGEYDRQLTIEQNKTNAMNNQLRERLNNENLSAEERKNIQLQIARNDEQLRKKQEEIEKKRFKVQKAINIANALVDTYRSGVMAFGSQLVIGDPSSPLRAQIAQGVAIAAGLANVAMIARQKFQSTAGGAPTAGALGGGSGGGDNTREFNFNLAGSTQSNQLTQSIAGQLSQPIQTYVVSSEITSQQQLDLNIANTATIGG